MEGVLAGLQYHGSDQPQEPPLGTSYLVTRGASFMNAFAVIRLYSILSMAEMAMDPSQDRQHLLHTPYRGL